MNSQLNIANCVFAMHAVLSHSKELSISKMLLIYPLVYQKSMLNLLSSKSNNKKSLEQLIINHPEYFSNFNNIFYSNLSVSINSLQYMHEMEHISIDDGNVKVINCIEFCKYMGDEIDKYYRSSVFISKILDMPSDYIYLNLRVAL
jgi:hypothetical protein